MKQRVDQNFGGDSAAMSSVEVTKHLEEPYFMVLQDGMMELELELECWSVGVFGVGANRALRAACSGSAPFALMVVP